MSVENRAHDISRDILNRLIDNNYIKIDYNQNGKDIIFSYTQDYIKIYDDVLLTLKKLNS